MSRYVLPIEQLVTEIFVRDIKRSTGFYRRLGFELLRDGGDFVELTWEDYRLFLAELSALQGLEHAELSAVPKSPLGNVRLMVPNVDEYWRLAKEIGAQIVNTVADRYLRSGDFAIADPDGFGIRSLADILKKRGALPVDESLQIGMQICEALETPASIRERAEVNTGTTTQSVCKMYLSSSQEEPWAD